MSRISVIVPVYNAEKTIGSCLDSLIAQTFNDIEIIIIDDGSEDATYKILQQYQSRNDRIIIIKQCNKGVSVARNEGIKIAKSEYIMFVDADDIVDIRICELLINDIEKTKSSTAICGINTVYRRNDEITYVEHDILNCKKHISSVKELGDAWYELCRKRVAMSPWAKLYDKKIILDNGVWFDKELKLQEDLIFNLEYFSHCNSVVICNKALYSYNVYSKKTLSNKFGLEREKNTELILNKYFDFWTKMERNPIVLQSIAELFYKNTMILIEQYIDNKKIVKDIFLNSMKYEKYDLINESNYPKNMELLIYNIVWKIKKWYIILILGRVRIFIKKLIRFS